MTLRHPPNRNWKPPYLKHNLRSRKAIANWLLNVPNTLVFNLTGGSWLFTWPTHASSADMSFDNLLEIYQGPSGEGHNDPAARDPGWLDQCRRRWANLYHPDHPSMDAALPSELMDNPFTLFDSAADEAASSFIPAGSSTVVNGGWQEMYDGTEITALFQITGNGDYLSLRHFEDESCDRDLANTLRVDIGTNEFADVRLRWTTLKMLHEYVRRLDHYFHEDNYRKEIEYYAASLFFERICGNLPNSTRDLVTAEIMELQRREFIAQLSRKSRRKITKIKSLEGSLCTTKPKKRKNPSRP